MNQSLKKCPSLQEIETFVIRNLSIKSDNKFNPSHLKSCNICQKRYQRLVRFYEILNEQLELPISNSVVNFIKQFDAPQMLLSFVLLKPRLAERNNFFDSEVVQIPANSELGLDDIADDEVVIRIVRNTGEVKTCFSVNAQNRNLYRNVEIHVVELDESLFTNEFGFGAMPALDINRLDHKTIQITPRKSIS